ncbi:MAG: putative sugar O-methyltransferase [Rhizobiales bacterium]|nr:putative sugar O-methyltransferase [Hyphomicrobiales bacterium]
MKKAIRAWLDLILKRYALEIVPRGILYDWQLRSADAPPRYSKSVLPEGAAEYLRPNNPKLIALQERYRKADPAVTVPAVWDDGYVAAEDIAYFRGDNGWVWQVRGRNTNILSYALTTYYLKSIDRLGLFSKLTEDNHFGNFSFTIEDRQVSRDLLDSISEINFLDRHLGIASRPGLNVLDIGAGYGRLAHRMVKSLPNIESYFCTDAVAASTFVSDYYLRFRNIERAHVVPLDEIDKLLAGHRIDLAVNIHSFSECRLEAIEWWARLLSKHRVKQLMIVPNDVTETPGQLLTNKDENYLPILERHGYRILVSEPKYADPVVQTYGIKPHWYHLLELQA